MLVEVEVFIIHIDRTLYIDLERHTADRVDRPFRSDISLCWLSYSWLDTSQTEPSDHISTREAHRLDRLDRRWASSPHRIYASKFPLKKVNQ